MNVLILIVFCLTTLAVKRGVALGILMASMLLWPEFSRFEVVVMQMSITRFVAIIILMKWWSSARLERNRYDRLVFLYWVASVVLATVAGADSKLLITIIGRSLDTVLMYYAARVCLIDSAEIKRFTQSLKYIATVATIMAIKESATAQSIYVAMRNSNSWAWGFPYEARLGSFVRAFGTTLQPIYWGMTMALTLMLYLAGSRFSGKKIITPAVIVILLGVFSSLSSGPLGTAAVVLALTFFIDTKRKFVLFIRGFVVFAIIIEILSNRHFYDMVQYLAMNSATAWYRSKLLSVAISNVGDYFWVGVGGDWPNHWGPQIDGRPIVDVVNQYVIVALNGGIILLMMYFYILFSPVTRFYKSWGTRISPVIDSQRVIVFSIISIGISGFTVGFYNPFEIMIYLLLGMARQLEVIAKREQLNTLNIS